MDKKLFAIGVLSVTALILMVANTLPIRQAQAYSIKDRDYQLVTTPNPNGGDSLYVTDSRTGQIAIFNWEPTTKSIRLLDRRNVADMFMAR